MVGEVMARGWKSTNGTYPQCRIIPAHMQTPERKAYLMSAALQAEAGWDGRSVDRQAREAFMRRITIPEQPQA